MATTTFEGAVRSKNGFSHVAVADNTGTETVTTIVNSSGELVADHSGAALTTEAGTGITTATGYAYSSECTKTGKVITTHIFIDITGLRSEATDGDIIGVDGGTANCHIGRIVTGDCGQVFAGSMTCLEVPAGGDPNIMLYSADEATGAENAAITGLTETALYDPNADWTLNKVGVLTAWPDMSVGEYLYLVQGDATGTDATYTAGQFLIELLGYEA